MNVCHLWLRIDYFFKAIQKELCAMLHFNFADTTIFFSHVL